MATETTAAKLADDDAVIDLTDVPSKRGERVEYKPTRLAYWSRFAVEVAIALAGFAITYFLFTAQSDQDARDRQDAQDERLLVQQETDRRVLEAKEFEILNQWLPEFLLGDDPQYAERMILSLSPSLAERIFSDIRESYEAAGLMDAALAVRLDDAIDGARRAEARVESSVVVVLETDDPDEADDLVAELTEQGFEGATVQASGEGFVVLVAGFESERAAQVVQEILAADNPDARVVDEQDAVTPVTSQVPEVFGLAEAEALALLEEAGFTNVVVWRVTSGSVSPGRVRELVLNDGASAANETEVVDETEVLISELPSNTALALKVVR